VHNIHLVDKLEALEMWASMQMCQLPEHFRAQSRRNSNELEVVHIEEMDRIEEMNLE